MGATQERIQLKMLQDAKDALVGENPDTISDSWTDTQTLQKTVFERMRNLKRIQA